MCTELSPLQEALLDELLRHPHIVAAVEDEEVYQGMRDEMSSMDVATLQEKIAEFKQLRRQHEVADAFIAKHTH